MHVFFCVGIVKVYLRAIFERDLYQTSNACFMLDDSTISSGQISNTFYSFSQLCSSPT